MTPRGLGRLAVGGGLIVALSAGTAPGWVFGGVAACTLVLGFAVSVKRFRVERTLARTVWRALMKG